jgi:hypothetical protein
MPATDSLKRLGGGRWETRDGRFAIEPQSGTWVIVDSEQADELGLPLVRGPFGSLTAAKEAIEAAREQGPAASPLAERLERAREAGQAAPTASTTAAPRRSAVGGGESESRTGSSKPSTSTKPPEPESPPAPRWLRDLEAADQRRARDLITRLQRMGVEDPEQVARSEVADGEPALARVAIERALTEAVHGSKDTPAAVRAAVNAILRGADIELGVGWQLVDDDGRRIEKVNVPESPGGTGSAGGISGESSSGASSSGRSSGRRRGPRSGPSRSSGASSPGGRMTATG